MKKARFVGAFAFVLSVASLACADDYNNTAGSRTLNQRRVAPQRTYRSYSYAPQSTPTVAPTQAAPAAPVRVAPAPAAQAPVVAQPRQPAQAQVAQTVPNRTYRSYSYQPNGNYGYQQRNWGLGANGDHYFSRADNKAMFRGGVGR